MKKRKNIFLLLALVLISIILFRLASYTYFSVEFDARDNYWPFARYYLMVYKIEILFMLLSVLSLFLSNFIKNIMLEKNTRLLMITIGYILKFNIVIALISALSAMHTLLYLNDFKAFIPISTLLIASSLILIFIVVTTLVFEIFNKQT